MAHNNYQPTHENVHTGLSGLNNDDKWEDMLNFRSSKGKTFVVPNRYYLTGAGQGLHSIVPGLNGHNYALGKCGSFGFVGADNVCTYQLWRLEQKFLNRQSARGAQSQRLVVQGNYTGCKEKKIKIAYFDGKATLVEPLKGGEDVQFYTGLTITGRYSSSGGLSPSGHACNSAVFKLLANQVEVGIINLNNESDGGDRESVITISPAQAEEISALSETPGQLDLSVVCFPEHPEFDLITWDGGCHIDLVWIIVESELLGEIYNGIPSGYFVSVNVLSQ